MHWDCIAQMWQTNGLGGTKIFWTNAYFNNNT